MALTLMYITNNPSIAKIADEAGVDRIFVDLEIIGKVERQGHLDTVISRHSLEDISNIKKSLINSKLLVRVNPINDKSLEEIDEVINRGAEIIMLPMFKTSYEVKTFIKFVDGRATTCLLLETKEAVEQLNEIIKIEGIDEIHIGLNDLHISYNKKFMFELLTDGTVEHICRIIEKKYIKYGFGGIASLGNGAIPPENIIPEHYRLGSSMVILGRSFCDLKKNSLYEVKNIFNNEVKKIRAYESKVKLYLDKELDSNRLDLKNKIAKIL